MSYAQYAEDTVQVPRSQYEKLVEALDDSQSLLVAILGERRPESEIEKQIYENRAALSAANLSQQRSSK